MARTTNSNLIKKLDEIHKDLKEVRQIDIPQIKIDVAVIKTKANSYAKIVSALGGILAVAISSVIALMK